MKLTSLKADNQISDSKMIIQIVHNNDNVNITGDVSFNGLTNYSIKELMNNSINGINFLAIKANNNINYVERDKILDVVKDDVLIVKNNEEICLKDGGVLNVEEGGLLNIEDDGMLALCEIGYGISNYNNNGLAFNSDSFIDSFNNALVDFKYNIFDDLLKLGTDVVIKFDNDDQGEKDIKYAILKFHNYKNSAPDSFKSVIFNNVIKDFCSEEDMEHLEMVLGYNFFQVTGIARDVSQIRIKSFSEPNKCAAISRDVFAKINSYLDPLEFCSSNYFQDKEDNLTIGDDTIQHYD